MLLRDNLEDADAPAAPFQPILAVPPPPPVSPLAEAHAASGGGASKDDARDRKVPLQLLPPEFWEDTARALAALARARSAVPTAAVALRFVVRWEGGEDLAEELEGVPTLAAALAALQAARVRRLPDPESELDLVALLDPGWVEGVARVLGYGAHKYAPWNWLKGKELSRDAGAALRHLLARARGEELDPESGLPHLDHAAACVLIVHVTQTRGTGKDDRRPRVPSHTNAMKSRGGRWGSFSTGQPAGAK